jgi:hypothetical protein
MELLILSFDIFLYLSCHSLFKSELTVTIYILYYQSSRPGAGISLLQRFFPFSYPRMNPSEDIGLGRSFRQYRANLSWDRDVSCCVPDTDCPDCRHYAASSAVVTARLYRHAINPDHFRSWLDFVDTYLAVWVMGYEKGKNLCNKLIPAPGREL